MTGNGTIPPKGGTAKETPMRFPSSRTAAEKRAHLLWKPPHTPRARVLLDRAERNAEAMSKAMASPATLPKNPAGGPSHVSGATGTGDAEEASDGRPVTD
ncbi:MAG: hypothetical protein AB7P12_11185 [Alphaproteobacteria bacterium]